MSVYKLEKDGAKKTIQAIYNNLVKKIYFINKKYKPNLVLDKPLHLKERKYEVNPKLDTNILEFVAKMEKKCSISNLNLMYHNLRNVKISNKITPALLLTHPISYLTGSVGGYYHTFFNELSITSKKDIESLKKHILYHELLHLASTNTYSNQAFSGFARICKKPIGCMQVGIGLNEGYTEYLAHDIFSTTNINPTYYALKECMDLLVKIIAKEKLDNYYFHNDLTSLRDDLAMYSSKEEANAFILDLDKFLVCRNSMERITNYLDKTYRIKLKKELDEGIVDKNYILDEIEEIYLKTKKINTIAKFKNKKQYYEYIKQFEAKEYDNYQYELERKKEKRRKITNIWS